MGERLTNGKIKLKVWLNRQWRSYLEAWTNLNGWRLVLFYTLNYTLLFLIMWHICYAPFAELGNSYIWEADGRQSYFPDLVYLSKTIRASVKDLLFEGEWTFPLYDFRLGPAKQRVSAEPLTLLAVFWPWDRIDLLYDFLVTARYYLAGLSFSLCGFYFFRRPAEILTGSVSYVFCGYTIFWGVTHPQFLGPMILLPLLIVGAEKIIRKEKPWLFCLCVWMTVVNSTYQAAMCAIVVFLYFVIRLFDVYQGRLQKDGLAVFGKFLLSGILGLALSGVVLIPSLLQNFGSGRIGTGETLSQLFYYGEEYYKRFINNFVATPWDCGYITYLGFSVLAIPALVLLFWCREKEKRSLRKAFLVLTGMLCCPIVAFALTGFNTLQNRWSFAYSFCVAFIITAMLPKIVERDPKQFAVMGIGMLAYFSVCFFLIERQFMSMDAMVLLLITLMTLFFFQKLGKRQALAMCLVVTCISSFYSTQLYYKTGARYAAAFTPKGKMYQYLDSSQYASFARSQTGQGAEGFYRIMEGDPIAEHVKIPFYWNLNGLTYYTSYLYAPYQNWLNELENVGTRYKTSSYDGPDERLGICSLLNVKYYVVREGSKSPIPYGFEEIERVVNGTAVDIIYENRYWLPVGYTYSEYFPLSEFGELTALEKQETLLQSAVIDRDTDLEKSSPTLSAAKIPVKHMEWTGATWENGELKVTQPNATVTLNFTGTENCETYLRFNNLRFRSGDVTSWDVMLTAKTESKETHTKFQAGNIAYSNGANNQILNLGYSDQPLTSCTITFQNQGTYSLDDLEIWCMPVDHYAEQIEALRAEPLENVETNWRGLTGTISTTKDKFLCFSIPYDKGWTAYVDGIKVDLLQANIGFMGVELPAGDHSIELKYWPPGLTIGIVLSCAGLAGTVGLVFWQGKKRKREGD